MYTFIHKKHPYIHVALFTISFLTLQALEETRKNDCTLFFDVTFSYFMTTVVTRSIIDLFNYAAGNHEATELTGPTGNIFIGSMFLLFEQNQIAEAICHTLGIEHDMSPH